MPSTTIGQEVTRGTICRDRWRASVTIVGSDRILAGTLTPMFVAVQWRRLRDGAEEPGRPDDAKEIVLELKSRRATGGAIQFESATGPATRTYRSDVREVVHLFGVSATTGAEPDVDLTVSIEGKVYGTFPMSVGPLAVALEIRAENGTDPAPAIATLEQSQRFRAVLTPATTGTFQWISGLPAALEIKGATDQAVVEAVSHPPSPGVRFLPLMVAFTPESGPMLVAIHNLDVRESIIFIMGVDPPRSTNRFYFSATAHFQRNPANRVETTLRNLREVREYLGTNRPANGQPWGDVSLVVHANEEGGMTIPVAPVPAGEDPETWRANPITLQAAMQARDLLPLPDEVVDARTLLRIRGCALGRSPEMLRLLSVAFGGDDPQRPIVRAPKHLQVYSAQFENRRVVDSDEFYFEFWFIGFPQPLRPADRPTQAAMVAEFRRQHGDPPRLDWADALRRDAPRPGVLADPHTEERTRHYVWTQSFSPTPTTSTQVAAATRRAIAGAGSWTNIRETSRTVTPFGLLTVNVEARDGGVTVTGFFQLEVRPDLSSQPKIRAFLSSLTPEQSHGSRSPTVDLTRTSHTVDDYSWTVTNTTAQSNGATLPAVEIHGRRTIMRVQRELTEEDPANPGQRRRAHPPITDLQHFGVELPPGATP